MEKTEGRWAAERRASWNDLIQREVWGQELPTSKTVPTQVRSPGSSCLGVATCTCKWWGHREEIPQSRSLGQLEFTSTSPSPAAPAASADTLDAEWIYHSLPFHLLGFYLSSSSLAPCCPKSGFGVHADLATLSGLIVDRSINLENFLTFKPCFCFLSPSFSPSAQFL